MPTQKNTEGAFRWIVHILQKRHIPFQISGGFAAKLYGSKRPLRDIDIEIPEASMRTVLRDVKDFVVYGPAHYKDRHFDVPLITLKYEGQKIDLSAADNLLLFDSRTHKWVRYPVHLAASVWKKVFGINVPVASAEHLMNYKSMMGEKVQVKDIEAIEEHL